jgi:DNA-binding Xre family transcriptional regulator
MGLVAQRVREEERPALPVVVAANVRRLRTTKEPKWSEEKLARKAELSRDTIRNIEDARDPTKGSNALRLDTLERIAQALGVEPARLLEWDPEAMRVYLHGARARLVAVG